MGSLLKGLDPEIEALIRRMWPGSSTPSGTSAVYAPLPRPSRATYLLPARPAAVTRAALMGFRPAHTAKARLRARAMSAAASLGAARLLPSLRVDTGSDNLVAHIAADLGDVPAREVIAGVSLGPRRANRKPVLQLCDPAGRTLAFVKVGVNPLTSHRIEVEAAALDQLRASEVPGLRAPAALAVGRWRDLVYLALEPVPTWSPAGIDMAARDTVLRELMRSTGRPDAPLAEQEWWLAAKSRASDAADDEGRSLLALMDRVETIAGDRLFVIGAAHGDFTPFNVATTGRDVTVWDWERYADAIPAGFDAMHYAFHEASGEPRQALDSVRSDAARLAERNGAQPDQGALIFAMYLVHIADRFRQDGQVAAGEKRGDLSGWLLPALTDHVGAL